MELAVLSGRYWQKDHSVWMGPLAAVTGHRLQNLAKVVISTANQNEYVRDASASIVLRIALEVVFAAKVLDRSTRQPRTKAARFCFVLLVRKSLTFSAQ